MKGTSTPKGSQLSRTATIFLSLSAAFVAIAVHQTIYNGLAQSYFLYMLGAGLFFGFALTRQRKSQGLRARLRRSAVAARPAAATRGRAVKKVVA